MGTLRYRWGLLLGLVCMSSAFAVSTVDGCQRILMRNDVGCCSYDSLSISNKVGILAEYMGRDGMLVEVTPSNLNGVEATLWTSAGEGPQIFSREPKGPITFRQGICGGKTN